MHTTKGRLGLDQKEKEKHITHTHKQSHAYLNYVAKMGTIQAESLKNIPRKKIWWSQTTNNIKNIDIKPYILQFIKVVELTAERICKLNQSLFFYQL